MVVAVWVVAVQRFVISLGGCDLREFGYFITMKTNLVSSLNSSCK